MECSRRSVKYSTVTMKSIYIYEKKKPTLVSVSSSGEGDPGNPEKCAFLFFFLLKTSEL